jgi:hypothetical protein
MIRLVILSFIISIELFSCTNQSGSTSGITFNDVAPVIYSHCTACHRPGSGAPFDLITYEDLKKHLHTVQLAVNERLMPPWPADTSYSHFIGEKTLRQPEIDLINNWIKNGAVEGNKSKLPPAPVFSASLLGKPDLTLTMKTFYIKGDNKDKFIMLKIPFELPADTFIRAIEIIPGNKKVVHHINAHLVQYDPG